MKIQKKNFKKITQFNYQLTVNLLKHFTTTICQTSKMLKSLLIITLCRGEDPKFICTGPWAYESPN